MLFFLFFFKHNSGFFLGGAVVKGVLVHVDLIVSFCLWENINIRKICVGSNNITCKIRYKFDAIRSFAPGCTYLQWCLCLFVGWLVGWLGSLWHINLCIFFNTKSIFYANIQFYFKQFNSAWVSSLIVKNTSISSYSVYSNSSNSANSV